MFVPSIPPELFEVLNAAVTAVCLVVMAYCGFYFVTEWRQMRRHLSMTEFETGRELLRRRLAFGTTIAFFGAGVRAAWVAIGIGLQDLGYDVSGMAKLPLILVPVAGTMILILGGACVSRAITPRSIGRWAYPVTAIAVAIAIALTRIGHR
jgi:hypothetical protein